jgi:preprotein translocase subunit SecA
VLDRKWREHLYEMDYLQEGIGLRAMAQRDPLVEYQREGFDMFAAMMEAIKEESVGFLFNLEVEVDDESAPAVEAAPAADGADEADGPQLDVSLLKAATTAAAEQAAAGNGKSAPHINAKGLNRDTSAKPLVYTSPELGSETPAVQTTKADNAPAASPKSGTARRQQSRTSNPNRGSRGNKPTRRKR